jgi:hypothetical protein
MVLAGCLCDSYRLYQIMILIKKTQILVTLIALELKLKNSKSNLSNLDWLIQMFLIITIAN